jgi:hypothetical protein
MFLKGVHCDWTYLIGFYVLFFYISFVTALSFSLQSGGGSAVEDLHRHLSKN